MRTGTVRSTSARRGIKQAHLYAPLNLKVIALCAVVVILCWSAVASADGTRVLSFPPGSSVATTSSSCTFPLSGLHGGKRYVAYPDEVRLGGDPAWRNNNPGNMRFTPFTRSHGAIGEAFKFAVFPSQATGAAAIPALLRTPKYQARTIRLAVTTYAPPNENDTEAYIAQITKATGAKADTLLSDLSAEQFTEMVDVIHKRERSKPGETYDRNGPDWVQRLLDCSRPPANTSIVGTWVGSYTCSQGLTGLQLIIAASANDQLTATFNFYPLPNNPSVPSGSFSMTGTFSPNSVVLNQDQWINQPPGYVMVNLVGVPPSASTPTFAGSVLGPGCTTFSLDRS